MKERLDFPFENKNETMNRFAKIKAKILLKQRLDFPFEKEIETTYRFLKIEG